MNRDEAEESIYQKELTVDSQTDFDNEEQTRMGLPSNSYPLFGFILHRNDSDYLRYISILNTRIGPINEE